MEKLTDIIIYLCDRYPHKSELSNARVTKMVFLADWTHALAHGSQITNIRWFLNHYGPYVDDILEAAGNSDNLEVLETTNWWGTRKQLIRLRSLPPLNLSPRVQDILDRVIRETSADSWADFIRRVYRTFPVRTQPRYTTLDLARLAESYNTHIKPLAQQG